MNTTKWLSRSRLEELKANGNNNISSDLWNQRKLASKILAAGDKSATAFRLPYGLLTGLWAEVESDTGQTFRVYG